MSILFSLDQNLFKPRARKKSPKFRTSEKKQVVNCSNYEARRHWYTADPPFEGFEGAVDGCITIGNYWEKRNYKRIELQNNSKHFSYK